MRLVFVSFLFAGIVWAQPLLVYSEFARIGANGDVIAPAMPREILSPAVARNGFTSFQVVVKVPAATPWNLYVAQNPENAVRVTLYRENGNRLEPVMQPARGTGTQIFWMDLWPDKGAPARRIKVEPQLNINNDWVIYPMEVRIMPATIPDGVSADGTRTTAPAEVMREFLCGAPPAASAKPAAGADTGITIAALQFRNAQQDRALAVQAPRTELQAKFGACDAPPPADNPEWYFRVRDFLYRLP